MRFFTTWPVALNEIARELKEMGILVTTKSVQNIQADITAYELQDYSYRVLQPDYTQIPLKCPEWAEAEFEERTSGVGLNPGKAWKFRSDYWEKFLNASRRFDYAYPERMSENLFHVINALKKDPSTRRAYLPIMDPIADKADAFNVRFPCSLGYHFLYRQGQLNITYYLRSSDFFEHFRYDVWLADRLKNFVAEKAGLKPGFFTHVIGSLHCFERDVKDVF